MKRKDVLFATDQCVCVYGTDAMPYTAIGDVTRVILAQET